MLKWIVGFCLTLMAIQLKGQIVIDGNSYKVKKVSKSHNLKVNSVKLSVFENYYNLNIETKFTKPIQIDSGTGYNTLPNVQFGCGKTNRMEDTLFLLSINRCLGMEISQDSAIKSERIEIDSAFFSNKEVIGYKYSHQSKLILMTDRWIQNLRTNNNFLDLEIWTDRMIYGIAAGTKESEYQLKVAPITMFTKDCKESKSTEEARIIFLSKRRARLIISKNYIAPYLQSVDLRKIRR